jgi:hypothetical protein
LIVVLSNPVDGFRSRFTHPTLADWADGVEEDAKVPD